MSGEDPILAALEAERAALDEALEAADSDGPPPAVAVVSPPFGGRDALTDHAVDRVDGPVDRRRLATPVDRDSVPRLPADGALLLENCQYLFRRRIDGFDPLDAFLDRLARREVPVVTGWNRYAWEYCRAISDVDELFTQVVDVGPLGTEGIRAVVTDAVGRPAFVDRDTAGRIRAVSLERAAIPLPGGRTAEIPHPRFNRAWVAVRLRRGGPPSIEREVYETIRRHSNGNPGVAVAIFDRSVRDGELAPSDVFDPPADLRLGDDAAVLLWIVVASEAVSRDALSESLVDGPVTVTLERLRARGLVSGDGDVITPAPAYLPAATAVLERKGLLW
jgi:hypothetical protein